MNWLKEKILVTGGTGLVGTCLVKRLKEHGCNVVSCGLTKGKVTANLMNTLETRHLFSMVNPSVVIDLAAKVGGVYANMMGKASFYMTNTLINTNIMREVQERHIPYVMAMGTGCAYPKRLEGEELFEEDMLDGIAESTNDAYAYSKRNLLVNLRACKEEYDMDYSYCILPNIFGENDNFHLLNSHVVPALIRKFVEAKRKNEPTVSLWGTGSAGRDFVYVEDVVDAFIRILTDNYNGSINIASGEVTYIKQLADTIQEITNYQGQIIFDDKFPDGQSLRIFNTDKIKSLGWSPNHSLKEGLTKTIKWYEKNSEGINKNEQNTV